MKDNLAPELAMRIIQLVEESGATKQEATAALSAAVALAPVCLSVFGPISCSLWVEHPR